MHVCLCRSLRRAITYDRLQAFYQIAHCIYLSVSKYTQSNKNEPTWTRIQVTWLYIMSIISRTQDTAIRRTWVITTPYTKLCASTTGMGAVSKRCPVSPITIYSLLKQWSIIFSLLVSKSFQEQKYSGSETETEWNCNNGFRLNAFFFPKTFLKRFNVEISEMFSD